MFLSSCWGPCFTVSQKNEIKLETAAIIIALYTALLHFLSFFYGMAILTDSVPTDTFFSPLFEFSRSKTELLSYVLMAYSLLFMVCCSYGLIRGVRSETRVFYFPWITCTLIELLFMASFGVFMVYRYYHYAWATFAALILWTYAGYHLYLFWVVVSLYHQLKEQQEPTFIIIYP